MISRTIPFVFLFSSIALIHGGDAFGQKAGCYHGAKYSSQKYSVQRYNAAQFSRKNYYAQQQMAKAYQQAYQRQVAQQYARAKQQAAYQSFQQRQARANTPKSTVNRTGKSSGFSKIYSPRYTANPYPVVVIPSHGWSDSQRGWGTKWSSGVVDKSGSGNSVYSSFGKVLTLPN